MYLQHGHTFNTVKPLSPLKAQPQYSCTVWVFAAWYSYPSAWLVVEVLTARSLFLTQGRNAIPVPGVPRSRNDDAYEVKCSSQGHTGGTGSESYLGLTSCSMPRLLYMELSIEAFRSNLTNSPPSDPRGNPVKFDSWSYVVILTNILEDHTSFVMWWSLFVLPSFKGLVPVWRQIKTRGHACELPRDAICQVYVVEWSQLTNWCLTAGKIWYAAPKAGVI